MATLSAEQRRQIKKQLEAIQERVNAIKAAQSGRVAGASTSNLNAAQQGGASGIGFESDEDQSSISEQVRETTEQGRSKSQTGGGGVPSTLSREEANFAVRGAGLSGILDPN